MGLANLEKDALFLNEVKLGRLRVSDDGRVFHSGDHELGKAHPDRNNRAAILVSWVIGNKRLAIAKNRLVWISKFGLIDDPNAYVYWKDGDKTNCHPSNLLLETYVQHAERVAVTANIGQKNGAAKLTDDQVLALRNEFASRPFSLKKRASELGISHTVLFDAIDGTSFKHVGGPTRAKISKISPTKLFLAYHLRTKYTAVKACQILNITYTTLRDRYKSYDPNLYEQHKAELVAKLSNQPEMLQKLRLV